MERNEINQFFSNEGPRNEVRMRVINVFAQEEPGSGNCGPSRYRYYVEQLRSGQRVYLERPAFLHQGFDFLVCVEGANYSPPGQRRRNAPSHKDIGWDLLDKRSENPSMYARLHDLLYRVFQCEDVPDWEMEGFKFSTGLPVDHILKVAKWLFIEQDIRYWNFSGRYMTWGVVPEP